MDATNEQLEAKIKTLNKRFKSKIDGSIQRMEAKFRELILGKSLHADSTLTNSIGLLEPIHLLTLQVTTTTTALTKTTRPRPPNHVALGVLHCSRQKLTKWLLLRMVEEARQWRWPKEEAQWKES